LLFGKVKFGYPYTEWGIKGIKILNVRVPYSRKLLNPQFFTFLPKYAISALTIAEDSSQK
jgi:hypothetical protein